MANRHTRKTGGSCPSSGGTSRAEASEKPPGTPQRHPHHISAHAFPQPGFMQSVEHGNLRLLGRFGRSTSPVVVISCRPLTDQGLHWSATRFSPNLRSNPIIRVVSISLIQELAISLYSNPTAAVTAGSRTRGNVRSGRVIFPLGFRQCWPCGYPLPTMWMPRKNGGSHYF